MNDGERADFFQECKQDIERNMVSADVFLRFTKDDVEYVKDEICGWQADCASGCRDDQLHDALDNIAEFIYEKTSDALYQKNYRDDVKVGFSEITIDGTLRPLKNAIDELYALRLQKNTADIDTYKILRDREILLECEIISKSKFLMKYIGEQITIGD